MRVTWMFQKLSWIEKNVIRVLWSIVKSENVSNIWEYIDDFKWILNVIIFQLLNVYILSNFFTELYIYTRKFDEVMMIEVKRKKSRKNTLNFTNWMRRRLSDNNKLSNCCNLNNNSIDNFNWTKMLSIIVIDKILERVESMKKISHIVFRIIIFSLD